MWEKKVKSSRGGKIEWVIANGCYCYCRRAPRHSGGSEDTVYFCANLHSEGPSRSLSPPHLCPPSYPWAPFSFSSLLTHSWYSNSSFSYLNYTFIGYYPAAGWGSAWLGLTAVQAAAERVLNREEPSKCSKDHRTVALSVTGLWGFEPVDSFLQRESVSPPKGKTFVQVQAKLRGCQRQETASIPHANSILKKVKMIASQMTNVQIRADSKRLCV